MSVSLEHFHKHVDHLSREELDVLPELIALRVIENEELRHDRQHDY